MIVFLIGFMGSGKTTLGKRLAKKIQYEFIDTDEYIESSEKCSISKIFEQHGEAYFRGLETNFLHNLAQGSNLVISTGGGMPCHGENMDIINQKGISVYLKLSPISLSNRLLNARTIRPLIREIEAEDLPAQIEKMLQNREPFYTKAKCILKGENAKPNHIISLIFGNDFK